MNWQADIKEGVVASLEEGVVASLEGENVDPKDIKQKEEKCHELEAVAKINVYIKGAQLAILFHIVHQAVAMQLFSILAKNSHLHMPPQI